MSSSAKYDLCLTVGCNDPVYMQMNERVTLVKRLSTTSWGIGLSVSAYPVGYALKFPSGTLTLTAPITVNSATAIGTITGTLNAGDTAEGNPISWAGKTIAATMTDGLTVTNFGTSVSPDGRTLSITPPETLPPKNIDLGRSAEPENLCAFPPKWTLRVTDGARTSLLVWGDVYIYG
jgi:hypothetical protein